MTKPTKENPYGQDDMAHGLAGDVAVDLDRIATLNSLAVNVAVNGGDGALAQLEALTEAAACLAYRARDCLDRLNAKILADNVAARHGTID
ncbi:hypothetical protein ACGYK5_17775 [Sulfitobacter sp. 1A16787]|uniref:hypothetical protein n=1 Tax=Sulfitobacter sp. 1A16787 TaxID=3368571 RepID=UPI0037467930